MSKSWFSRLITAWQSYFALQKLTENSLVFYAESNADWAHMGQVVRCLVDNHRQPLICVTSDINDPILNNDNPLMKTFFIGDGTARTLFFQGLKARAMVMTLTDLNVYYLKRSINPVHYFYIFHALVSSHAAYRQHAFDSYDSIFCVGPYHVDEIRFQEKVYGLRAKNLLEGGYCRLDQLMNDVEKSNSPVAQDSAEKQLTVLVSPTWGESSMVGRCLEEILQILTDAKINTILRLHPMTLRYQPDLPERLEKRFLSGGFFTFDRQLQTTDSLLRANVMIADHGGSGIEFALGLKKPVISIATPAKIHNPGRDRIELPLFEDIIRPLIGEVLRLDQLASLPETVKEIHTQAPQWRQKLADLHRQFIFNTGSSASVMAEHVYRFVSKSEKGSAP